MITGGLPASRLGFEPSTRRFDSYTVNQMSRPVFAFGKMLVSKYFAEVSQRTAFLLAAMKSEMKLM